MLTYRNPELSQAIHPSEGATPSEEGSRSIPRSPLMHRRGISSVCNENNYISVLSLGLEHLFLKLESMNPSGSVKLKAAKSMIAAAERMGHINSNTMLIESSSGSLGVALSMIAAEQGYHFTCVVDPNVSEQNLRLIKTFGAKVVQVTEKDENGGYLGTRIRYIKERTQQDPNTLWLNQYANPENPGAHFRETAPGIANAFPRLDYLFIGAGTTGTLMGCLKYFSLYRPKVKIVAVDSVGSVTFGEPAGKRFIPGLGTSRRPEIFDPQGIFAYEMIPEIATVRMCRHLAKAEGILVGGSTGTTLAGVAAWRSRIPEDAVVVAISPDLGDRYLDTIYNDEWVTQKFGPAALADSEPTNALPSQLQNHFSS